MRVLRRRAVTRQACASRKEDARGAERRAKDSLQRERRSRAAFMSSRAAEGPRARGARASRRTEARHRDARHATYAISLCASAISRAQERERAICAHAMPLPHDLPRRSAYGAQMLAASARAASSGARAAPRMMRGAPMQERACRAVCHSERYLYADSALHAVLCAKSRYLPQAPRCCCRLLML